MSDSVPELSDTKASRGARLLDWLAGFGFVFTFSFALIASMLALFGKALQLR
jgi:hypothetical protein